MRLPSFSLCTSLIFLLCLSNVKAYTQDSTTIMARTPQEIKPKVHRCIGDLRRYVPPNVKDTSEWWPCSGDNSGFDHYERECPPDYVAYKMVTWPYTNDRNHARCYFKCVKMVMDKSNCHWGDV